MIDLWIIGYLSICLLDWHFYFNVYFYYLYLLFNFFYFFNWISLFIHFFNFVIWDLICVSFIILSLYNWFILFQIVFIDIIRSTIVVIINWFSRLFSFLIIFGFFCVFYLFIAFIWVWLSRTFLYTCATNKYITCNALRALFTLRTLTYRTILISTCLATPLSTVLNNHMAQWTLLNALLFMQHFIAVTTLALIRISIDTRLAATDTLETNHYACVSAVYQVAIWSHRWNLKRICCDQFTWIRQRADSEDYAFALVVQTWLKCFLDRDLSIQLIISAYCTLCKVRRQWFAFKAIDIVVR